MSSLPPFLQQPPAGGPGLQPQPVGGYYRPRGPKPQQPAGTDGLQPLVQGEAMPQFRTNALRPQGQRRMGIQVPDRGPVAGQPQVQPQAAQTPAAPDGDLRGKTVTGQGGFQTRYDEKGRAIMLDPQGNPVGQEGMRGTIGSLHSPSVFQGGKWVNDAPDPVGYLEAVNPQGFQNQGFTPPPQSSTAATPPQGGNRTPGTRPWRGGPPQPPVQGGPGQQPGEDNTIVHPPYQPPVPPAGQFGGPGITGGPDPAALQNLFDLQNEDRPGAPGVVGAGPSGGYTIAGSPGVEAGYRTPQGKDVMDSPSLKAAVDAFNAYQRPMIENQMATAGLGRSNAMGNATALALGQQMPQFIEQAFGREERGLERGGAATEAEINRRQALDINQSNANLQTIPLLMQMGQNDYARQMGQIGAASDFGGLQRGVEQGENDAAFQDFMRRQGLAEQGTYAPFGQTVPSTFGSTSLTSKS